mmetsp:Transcript_47974/g.74932  ORF Transcript_47974/g.74932 Transcript_47974/m.74932 type:complete len:564 (+) Transcript_47974:934-2625(+)
MSVDDTPVNHMVLERIFQKEGYAFTICNDGMQALSQIEDRQYLPDLVLLDVMMPHMSGIEVCTTLRKKYGSMLPVLLISAKGDEANIVEGFDAGCDDYITKPFKRKELVARVHSHCYKHTGSAPPRPMGRAESSLVDDASDHSSQGGHSLPHKEHGHQGQQGAVDQVRALRTILMLDIVDWYSTEIAIPAEKLYTSLEKTYTACKHICEEHGLQETAATIRSDCFMATAGPSVPLKEQALKTHGAAVEILGALGAMSDALAVRMVIMTDIVSPADSAQQVTPVSAAACAAGLQAMEGCPPSNIIVFESVSTLLAGQQYEYAEIGVAKLSGIGPERKSLLRHSSTTWGQAKSHDWTRTPHYGSPQWNPRIGTLKLRVQREQHVATQREASSSQASECGHSGRRSSLESSLSATPEGWKSLPAPPRQQGSFKFGDSSTAESPSPSAASRPLVLLDDPSDQSDFIDRLARTVVILNLPRCESLERRTLSRQLRRFGVLLQPVETRKSRAWTIGIAEMDSESSASAAAKGLNQAEYKGSTLVVETLFAVLSTNPAQRLRSLTPSVDY